MGAVSGMAQVNVRVDRQVKNRAEEALRLSALRCPSSSKKSWPRSHRVAGSVRKCCLPLMAGNRPSRTILRSPHHGRRRSALCRFGHRYVARIRRSRLGHNLFRSHGRALSPKGDDPVSGAPLKIMVDANVWVDSFCADHAESLAARALSDGRRGRGRCCSSRCISLKTCCTLSNTS